MLAKYRADVDGLVLSLFPDLRHMTPFHKTRYGKMIYGDSLAYMATLPAASVNLIVTSPPFGLGRKKDYGNKDADRYVE